MSMGGRANGQACRQPESETKTFQEYILDILITKIPKLKIRNFIIIQEFEFMLFNRGITQDIIIIQQPLLQLRKTVDNKLYLKVSVSLL